VTPLGLLFFVQVVLESLPVSSSGHLALLVQLLVKSGKSDFAGQLMVLDGLWNALLHLPTLVILALYFLPPYLPLLLRPARSWRLVVRVAVLTVLADLIAGILYIRYASTFKTIMPLWGGFALTVAILLSLRWCPRVRPGTRLTAWRAVALAFLHLPALMPGVSRLATVFTAARWLGFRGRRAFEIAWLLHAPLIIAATARDLLREGTDTFLAPLATPCVLAPLVLATILGYLALCLSGYLARANRLWWFAYYMVIPTALAFVL